MAGSTGVQMFETPADMVKGFKSAPLWAGKSAGFATLFIIRAEIEHLVGGDCPHQVGGRKTGHKKDPNLQKSSIISCKVRFSIIHKAPTYRSTLAGDGLPPRKVAFTSLNND